MQTFAPPKIPFDVLMRADEAGIRLEIQGDLPIWEHWPGRDHQEAVDDIRASIHQVPGNESANGCACRHYSDLYVRFPDGSLKRPDISVFCRRPEQAREAVTLLPEAVVEIISYGSELKDLELGPPYYLSQGVKDVIVFDPETKVVVHRRVDGIAHYTSPVTLDLECGCRVTV